MEMKLSLYKLGRALTKIESKYEMEFFTKIDLSGGWMTLNGIAKIQSVPQGLSLNGSNKGNNVIEIRIGVENSDGTIIKIIGGKEKVFKVDVSSSKYMEFKKGEINKNEVKEDKSECKLRIDENVIIKIKASTEEIMKLIKE